MLIELPEAENPQKLPMPSFSTPHLQWGRKKRLRCFNAGPSSPVPVFQSRPPSPGSKTATALTFPSPISPLPAMPLSDPPKLLVRLRVPIRKEGSGEKEPLVGEKLPDQVTRGCNTSPETGEEGKKDTGMFLRSRSRNGGEKGNKRVELRVSLTTEEIEEDFIAMTGSKPPRRPKKRSRDQSYLEQIFPGSSLPRNVTPDMY